MYGWDNGGNYHDNWFNIITLSMKRIWIFICAIWLSSSVAIAEEADRSYQQLERQISVLKQSNARLNSNVRELTRQNQQRRADIDSLQAKVQKQTEEIAELAAQQTSNIKRIDGQLELTNGNVEQNKSSLSKRTTWGIIASGLFLALLGIAVYLLRRRISQGTSTIDEVKSAQGKLQQAQVKLQEESIKLDEKLVEVLDKQLPAIDIKNQGESDQEPDHSLALKVADEIVRIEKNLSNMDSSIKGYKPLSKAVQRIKDNFMAYGYEMVEMLGKPYSDGMKASVTFVTDENMKDGEKIITRVIKPQVNYNGVMIQIAQIEVSQSE